MANQIIHGPYSGEPVTQYDAALLVFVKDGKKFTRFENTEYLSRNAWDYKKCIECETWFHPSAFHLCTADDSGAWLCDECGEALGVCDTCHKTHRRDCMYTIDGRTYCTDCINDYFVQCEECGEWLPIDDGEFVTTEDTGNTYCYSCAEHVLHQCEDCGEWYAHTDRIIETVNGHMYCENCFENSDYVRCEECGDVIHYDDAQLIDDVWYCDDCAERVGDDGTIESYHSKGVESDDWEEFRTDSEDDQNTRLYGLEIEIYRDTYKIERGYLSNCAKRYIEHFGDNFIHAEKDGSLKERGFELITEPFTRKYMEKHLVEKIDEFCDMAENDEFAEDGGDMCGLHCHATRTRYTAKAAEKLNEFMLRHMYAFRCLSMRTDFYYCRFQADTDDHYSVVNTEHSQTIELRLFRGTLHNEIIAGLPAFFGSMLNVAHDNDMDNWTFADFILAVIKDAEKNGDDHLVRNLLWRADDVSNNVLTNDYLDSACLKEIDTFIN